MRRLTTWMFLMGIAPAAWMIGTGARVSAGIESTPLSEQTGGDWYLNIRDPGQAVYMAIPDFEAIGEGVADASNTLSEVVWNDMEFASIYRLTPKRLYQIGRTARNDREIDYYQWESINADILIKGTAEIIEERLISEVRIYAIRAQEMVFGKRYEAPLSASRQMAHQIADDILLQAGNYRGVNRTKIAFTSDRRGEQTKEIYLMDYDGHGQRPLTANGSLNLMPSWSPDGKALAYISYRTGTPSLHRAFIFEGRGDRIPTGPGMTFSPAWSPDGARIAFSSTRDGNSEIYIANADGSDITRLTDHPQIDTSPSWSPTGREIAFTSDRAGAPQIYAMDTDGLNLRRVSFQGSYNDAPSWSPSKQFSELIFASRIERGPFDIVVYNFETRQTRQLTTGRGSNEGPSWSPNGLHIVFTSSRAGSNQIYTMNRDGSNPRRLTSQGKNTTAQWGPFVDSSS